MMRILLFLLLSAQLCFAQNRNHAVMTKGTGLWGGSSSAQSALIVKQPGNTNMDHRKICNSNGLLSKYKK